MPAGARNPLICPGQYISLVPIDLNDLGLEVPIEILAVVVK